MTSPERSAAASAPRNSDGDSESAGAAESAVADVSGAAAPRVRVCDSPHPATSPTMPITDDTSPTTTNTRATRAPTGLILTPLSTGRRKTTRDRAPGTVMPMAGHPEHYQPRRRIVRWVIALAMLIALPTAVTILVITANDDSTDNNRSTRPSTAATSLGTQTTTTTTARTQHTLLAYGSAGPEVTTLQERLAALGHDPGPIDGMFGTGTARAVAAFQAASGLTPDGIVGAATWAALDAA